MTLANRRQFLATSAGLGLGWNALSLGAPAGLLPAVFAGEGGEAASKPEPVKLAIMGVNGRGRQLMSVLQKFPEAEIAYICDPDAKVIPGAVKQWTDAGRPEPKVVSDFRRALDDQSVQALVCAAPDHWHALAAIWACQAGKDVYVEKPCCHNPIEGQRMIQAARKHQRIVQVGSQRRSGADMQAMAEVVR